MFTRNEQWRRARELFDTAVELETGERNLFLEKACAGDVELRGEVLSLLEADRAESFIERPAYEFAAELFADEEDKQTVGQRIGAYKIIREIGRGGMGAVYLAERADDQYRTQVAVKLIKRGMDTDHILRRFRNERQILANLNHPNIARLLDSGTTEDGLPYFVMEYVEGQPIDVYCNERKLPTTERLKLFRTTCAAVQHAHQNLIVHRDIKPSNILVTPDGTPKLLDFGIAKLLHNDSDDGATMLTAIELRVMTPEYASPEQIRGERITTASDVYSLGVVLYELLTGCRPYHFKSRRPDDVAKVICEQEPQRPSTAISKIEKGSVTGGLKQWTPARVKLTRGSSKSEGSCRELRGDVDNIVLMCLRKEPSRRYASVEQLSEDVRRHLEALPVRAHKDTLVYRADKFVRRNKRMVAVATVAASLILATLIGGIIATTRQARRAERRFNDVRRLANSFMFELNDEIEQSPTKARELLVRRALEYLDSLAQEAGNDLSLQRELAAAYQKVGDVQSQLHRANVGDSQGALQSYRKSLALREAIVAANPKNTQARLDLAVSYNRNGDILSKTGNSAAALESYRKASNLFEQLQNIEPKNADMLREMSGNYTALGRAILKTGDSTEALVIFRKAQAIRESLAAENPQDANARNSLISAFQSTAFVLMESGDTGGALALYRKALEIGERLVAENPTSNLFRRSLHSAHWGIALALRDAGDIEASLEHQRKALDIAQELLRNDPTNTQARNDLADAYMEYANTLRDAQQTTVALENYREAIRNYEIVRDADRSNIHAQRQIYFTYRHLGDAQMQANDTAAARETFRRALIAFQDLSARDPANTEFQNDLAISYRKLGEVLLKTGDFVAASENFQKALPLAESLSAQSPMNAYKRRDLALTYFDLGATNIRLAEKGKMSGAQQKQYWEEGRDWYQKSFDIWQEMRRRNKLNRTDALKSDDAAREIARCDSALARLL